MRRVADLDEKEASKEATAAEEQRIEEEGLIQPNSAENDEVISCYSIDCKILT